MSKSKICLVTLGHDALDDRIFYKEAISLRKMFTRVTVLATGREERRLVEGVKVVTIRRGRFTYLTLWRLWQASREERARCYHLHEPLLLPVALLLRCYRHVKIIYDIHEHLPEMVEDFSTRSRFVVSALVAIFSLIERWMVRTVDAVLVTSDLLVRRYRRWNPRIVAIFNYPRVELFSGIRPPPPTLLRQYRSARVVLYHGQLSRAREILTLIRAVKQVSQSVVNIKLILLGPVFGDSYRDELISILQREDVGSLVHLLEPVPHPQVPSYISLSEVGLVVLPPRSVFKLNLPIKLFEYMSCGVPVVVGRLPIIEDIVEETKCGLLVKPSDVEAIAEAIRYILNHRQEAREMGRRGQMAVRKRYNWSQMEHRLFRTYQNLLGEPI